MTKSNPSSHSSNNPSRDTRNPAPADLPGQNAPPVGGSPSAKRARETRRELFEKYHYNGLDIAENDPEIYPEYRPDGPPGVYCEACGKAKAVCKC